MCGLAGFLSNKNHCKQTSDEMEFLALRMAGAIKNRGPNDSGVWVDPNAGIAIGHARLSILDLSSAGHQPMISESGRYVIAFNGEIYNHLELRQELVDIYATGNLTSNVKGKHWKSNSDTETLLAGFETWGIESTLKKTVGMFSISLFDRHEKILTLARDRIGEKPLYYGFQKNTFLFGSELKALKAHPAFLNEIDRDVLCLYLRHCYIPAPYSIYKGIKKLLPGTYIQLHIGVDFNSQSLIPKEYWSLDYAVANGLKNPYQGSDSEAVIALDKQLKQTINLQMLADVPVGAFLSGGVDSSVIVSLMQAQTKRPVRTFSIGFDEAGYNEAVYAKAVAKHLGTDHEELYVTANDAFNVIPLLAKIYDEPFADSSQIPTYLLSKMAKRHVDVSLSGDAGDELFCGYNRYVLANKWKKIQYLPFPIRKTTGRLINKLSVSTWDDVFSRMKIVKKIPNNAGQKLQKLANRLEEIDGINSLYYSLVSEINQPEHIVLGGLEPQTWLTKTGIKAIFKDPVQHMMFMDAMTYLPDDILVKVDRAAMANSLETRVPFLDHRVVEFAWQLPMNMKMRDGATKWILREVLYQYVPKELIDRPKAGFAIPVAQWLRGPLEPWVESLIDSHRLKREGYFNVDFVRELWRTFKAGNNHSQSLIWSILMFQSWLEETN